MYHIIKSEDPFNYPKLLVLQKKNKVPRQQKSKQACSYAATSYVAAFGDYIEKLTMNS